MITRKDVAEKTGVSVATVSNVINNKACVSEALKKKVNKAIVELNYKPNLVARGLKMKKTRSIILISNDITNPFHSELLMGMEKSAYNQGYSIALCNARENLDGFSMLMQRQFDGLVVATEKIEVDKINCIAANGTPVVVVANKELKGMDARVITADISILKGALKLFKHLTALGHRKIAFIAPSLIKGAEDTDYRFMAYKKCLKELGEGLDGNIIDYNCITVEDAYESTCRFMSKAGSKLTAVYSGNDIMAAGVLAALRDMSISVPEEVSVVGFDNIPCSKYYCPPLTTVDVKKYNLGERIMDVMIGKLERETVYDGTEGNPVCREIRFDAELIIRKSTCISRELRKGRY